MFNKLYDLNIVNGTFEGEIFSGDDYYTSIISGETNQPDYLIKEIETAIQSLKIEGISEEDFITSKNSMYGNMIESFENVEEVATNMVNAHFKGRTVYTSLEVLSKLTLDDVNEQLRRMFDPDRKCIFTVLPSEATEE